MLSTVRLAGNNVGGVVQGLYGTYTQGSDGTFTVSTGDLDAMLRAGMTNLRNASEFAYIGPKAPGVASATQYLASTTLSNGTIALSTQPDVPRQAQAVITGINSPAASAGTVTITYRANDGGLQTDVISLPGTAIGVTPMTFPLTKGVVHFISPATVAGLAGGTNFITIGSTAFIAVPVDPGAVDVTFTKETSDAGDETVGTASTTSLACIAPSVGITGTHTYQFAYTYLSPIQ